MAAHSMQRSLPSMFLPRFFLGPSSSVPFPWKGLFRDDRILYARFEGLPAFLCTCDMHEKGNGSSGHLPTVVGWISSNRRGVPRSTRNSAGMCVQTQSIESSPALGEDRVACSVGCLVLFCSLRLDTKKMGFAIPGTNCSFIATPHR